MAISSYGYPGTVASGFQWGLFQMGLGSRWYGVYSQTHARPTGKTDGVRQVEISTGYFWGRGITDSVTSPEVVTLPEVTAGTRYFMIVARRTWQTTNATTFTYIDAGTTLPSTLPDHEDSLGDVDDQPFAIFSLASTGSQVPTLVYDLRTFGSQESMFAYDMPTAMLVNNQVGARVRFLSGAEYRRILSSSGSGVWQKDPRQIQSTSLVSSVATGFSLTPTPIAIASGNTIDLRVVVKRTGAQITPSTTAGSAGKIAADTPVAYLAQTAPDGTRLWPAMTLYGITFSIRGVQCSGRLETNGTLTLTAVPNESFYINTNDTILIDAVYNTIVGS